MNVDSISFFHGKNSPETGQESLVKLNWRYPRSFTANKCTKMLWTGQLSRFFHQDLAELGQQAGSASEFSFIPVNLHGSGQYFLFHCLGYLKHLLNWKKIKGDGKAELELAQRL